MHLASTALLANLLPVPTSRSGVNVQVNGVDAPLLFVSHGQVNLQIPWEMLEQAQVSISVTMV